MAVKTILVLAAASALSVLGGCTTTTYPAEVARFQAMPAPAGQSFVVLPIDQGQLGSAEFGHYAGIVRRHMLALGYTEAASPADATLIACFSYGIDRGGQPMVIWNSWYGPRADYDDQSWHTGQVDLQIHRAGDGVSVFEGHARANGTHHPPTRIVADLIDAMFTGFPGHSGETVWINVPDRKS